MSAVLERKRASAVRGSLAVGALPLLSPLAGIGRYTRDLLDALEDLAPGLELSYYTGRWSRSRPRATAEGRGAWFRAKQAAKGLPYAGRLLRRAKDRLARFSPAAYDAYFEPNFILSDLPARRRVTTVHDLSFVPHPDWHDREAAAYFRRGWLASARRADLVLADSEHVRLEILACSGLEPERVRTVPLGVDPSVYRPFEPDSPADSAERAELRARYGDYLLYVGSLEPRKNLKRLLEAYRRLPAAQRRAHPLLLAGATGWRSDELPGLAAEAGALLLGYVPEARLAALYRSAALFAYPSLYEGFGLPPAEAMASGCPVLVSRGGALEEVVGEAGRLVDPLDPDSIAEGLSALLGDSRLRAESARLGLARSARYRWADSAAAVLEALFPGALH